MIKKLKKLFLLCFIVAVACLCMPPLVFAAEKVLSNSLGMEFVLIPSGTFIMGSPQDEPYRQKREEVQHTVTISKAFYLQNTEVTLKQWWAVMGKRFFGRRKGTAVMPAAKVSWYDCVRFIKKLNNRNEGVYRLPTEAEWEYACRSGSTTAYNWGEAIDCTNAMYSNKSKKSNECLDHVRSSGLAVDRPAPVKSYPPNAWGLFDMHGNVWEWCHDWYGDYPNDPVIDPRGPDSGTKKIRRGGSWFGHGYSCRSANRNYSHPASRYHTTGFRLVWSKTADLIGKEGERELFLREEEREGGP